MELIVAIDVYESWVRSAGRQSGLLKPVTRPLRPRVRSSSGYGGWVIWIYHRVEPNITDSVSFHGF